MVEHVKRITPLSSCRAILVGLLIALIAGCASQSRPFLPGPAPDVPDFPDELLENIARSVPGGEVVDHGFLHSGIDLFSRIREIIPSPRSQKVEDANTEWGLSVVYPSKRWRRKARPKEGEYETQTMERSHLVQAPLPVPVTPQLVTWPRSGFG